MHIKIFTFLSNKLFIFCITPSMLRHWKEIYINRKELACRMEENWDSFWNANSFLIKLIQFMREHYFADIPLHYLGKLEGKKVLEAGCGTCETLVRISKKAKKSTKCPNTPKRCRGRLIIQNGNASHRRLG